MFHSASLIVFEVDCGCCNNNIEYVLLTYVTALASATGGKLPLLPRAKPPIHVYDCTNHAISTFWELAKGARVSLESNSNSIHNSDQFAIWSGAHHCDLSGNLQLQLVVIVKINQN